jgi:hypothetical protein
MQVGRAAADRAGVEASASRPNGYPAPFDQTWRAALQRCSILESGYHASRPALAIYLILLLYSRVSKLNLGLKSAFPRFLAAPGRPGLLAERPAQPTTDQRS